MDTIETKFLHDLHAATEPDREERQIGGLVAEAAKYGLSVVFDPEHNPAKMEAIECPTLDFQLDGKRIWESRDWYIDDAQREIHIFPRLEYTAISLAAAICRARIVPGEISRVRKEIKRIREKKSKPEDINWLTHCALWANVFLAADRMLEENQIYEGKGKSRVHYLGNVFRMALEANKIAMPGMGYQCGILPAE